MKYRTKGQHPINVGEATDAYYIMAHDCKRPKIKEGEGQDYGTHFLGRIYTYDGRRRCTFDHWSDDAYGFLVYGKAGKYITGSSVEARLDECAEFASIAMLRDIPDDLWPFD